eukprot:TRINITY_DN4384_c0_g1_i3.p1 TRINITY_DN4384_c0_g1~~TRINITY_DN4384_c0_g1_i3.p1  ORF type:complete len:120 (+),score=10.28 TRINITY_DN4384_c0_g1_i3:9-368(+)
MHRSSFFCLQSFHDKRQRVNKNWYGGHTSSVRAAMQINGKLQHANKICHRIGSARIKYNRITSCHVTPARTTAEEVHWSVVNEVPDAASNDAIRTLIDFRSLDHFLLHSANLTPDAHEA